MKNEDNECFRWCHIRHLNPQDKDPQRIKKSDKQYIKNLDYTGIELTNKEASTVFCSVVKHAGSGRERKKCRRKHETKSSVFPHFLSALPLPKCFTAEQSTVEASLFVL